MCPWAWTLWSLNLGNGTQCFGGSLGVDAEMILFVGRLVEKKGVHNLLAAMQRVLKSSPKATLVLVGDGTQRHDLERMAERLEIAGSVRFLGKLPHEQLPEYYAAADLFVGPSVVDRSGDTEGLGVVFIEAASAGLAMVGTSVGGISDVLDPRRYRTCSRARSA